MQVDEVAQQPRGLLVQRPDQGVLRGAGAVPAEGARGPGLVGQAGGQGEQMVLKVTGREVAIPSYAGGVARASFWELCGRPLGPGRY